MNPFLIWIRACAFIDPQDRFREILEEAEATVNSEYCIYGLFRTSAQHFTNKNVAVVADVSIRTSHFTSARGWVDTEAVTGQVELHTEKCEGLG